MSPRARSVILRSFVLTAVFEVCAGAFTVTYSTTGSFSGGSTPKTNVFTTQNGTVTFAATPGSVTSPPRTTANLGVFLSAVTSGTLTPGGTFVLGLSQSSPSAGGPRAFTAALSGTIRATNSGLNIFFGSGPFTCFDGTTFGLPGDSCNGKFIEYTTLNINGVVYGVQTSTNLNPPNTIGGQTGLNGFVDASAVPEPAFYGLTAVGFAGLLIMAIRRKRQRKATA